MLVTVYSLNDARVLEVKRLSPRKAHRYLQWLSQNSDGIYWTCWPTELAG